MKKVFLSAILVSLALYTIGQGNIPSPTESLLPLAPTAAALGEYNDIPVNGYTGLPSIGVPVYQINYNGITVPINLSYHANGIKVSEEASWVGLGWSLNAGGVISRTIRGQDDFTQGTGYATIYPQLPKAPDLGIWEVYNFIDGVYESSARWISEGIENTPNNTPPVIPFDDDRAFNRNFFCPFGEKDLEPDLFSFSFGNYSGKFVQDLSGNYLPVEAQKMDIQYANDSWVITTNDGYRYYFGTTDNSRQQTYNTSNNQTMTFGMGDDDTFSSSQSNFISSWFLERIETPDYLSDGSRGSIVTFTYDKSAVDTERIRPIPSYSEEFRDILDLQQTSGTVSANCSTLEYERKSYTQTVSEMSYDRVYLQSINYDLGKVEFITSNRDDVVNDRKLDWIEMSYNGIRTKKFKLSYDYFSSNSINSYSSNTLWNNKYAPDPPSYADISDNRNQKRLKLISIQDFGNTSSTTIPSTGAPQPYLFEYNTSTLPPKTSLSIDHWGYANDANNTNLVPIWSNTSGMNFNQNNMLGGANRNANDNYTLGWLLNKIILPTGGERLFGYEPNKITTTETVSNEITCIDIFGENTDDFEPTTSCDDVTPLSVGTPISGMSTPGIPHRIGDVFQIASSSGNPTINFSGFFEYKSFCCVDGTRQGYCVNNNGGEEFGFILRLIKNDDRNNPVRTWSSSSPNDVTIADEPDGSGYTIRIDYEDVAEFNANYSLEITYFSSFNKFPDNLTLYDFIVTCGTVSQNVLMNQSGGGVRIATLEDRSNSTTLAKKQVFRYTDDSNNSTGKVINQPYYSYFEDKSLTVSGCNNPPFYLLKYLVRSANSLVPLSSAFAGSFVGYDEVEMTIEDDNGGIAGKREMFFYNEATLDVEDDNIAGLPNFYNLKNGKLLSQIDYEYQNNTFTKVQELINTYNNIDWGDGRYWIWSIKPFTAITDVEAPTPLDACLYTNQIDFYAYANVRQWHYIKQTSQIVYDEDGLNPITTITTFDYDDEKANLSDNTYNIIETEITNSDDIQYITRTQYPLDYEYPANAVGAAIGLKSLIDKHIINAPIESTQYVKLPNRPEQVLSSTVTEYKSSGFPYPDKVWRTEYERATISSEFTPSYIGNMASTFFKDDDYQCHGQSLPQLTYNHYDAFGNPTEIQQTHDQSVAMTWSHDGTRMTSITKNASEEAVAFTSFEYPGDGTNSDFIEDGNWNYQIQGITSGAHYTLNGGFLYNPDERIVYTNTNIPTGKYIISFWARNASSGGQPADVIIEKKDGSTITIPLISLDWREYHQEIDIDSSSDLEITIRPDENDSDIIIIRLDDLRLHPADAMMTSYAYDADTRLLNGMSDESNRRTTYEYDDLLRLQTVKDFEDNIIQALDYKYAGDGNVQNQNYIQTQEVLLPNQKFLSEVNNLSIINGQVRRNYQYFDGLGRPIQSVAAQASFAQKDIVSWMEYDQFNRMDKEYLPYTVSSNDPGYFRNSADTEQPSFYQQLTSSGVAANNGPHAFTRMSFEASPLNRPTAQNAPGLTWSSASRAVRTEYRANTPADAVHDFRKGMRNSDIFAANELNVVKTTDENGNVSRVYTDKLGRQIMSERVLNATEMARTYTAYDDYNKPVAIIPPQLAADMEAADDWNIYHIKNFRRIYAYRYNDRRLLSVKAIPGGGTTELYYNKLDLPVMTIDNNDNQIITKYDRLKRPIVTGEYKGSQLPDNSSNLPLVYEEVDGSQIHNYTLNNSFPTDANTQLEVHSVTYYDDYDLGNDGMDMDDPSYSPPPNTTDYESAASTWTRNMVTSTKTGILESDGSTNTFLSQHSFYDERARVIQTQSEHHLNGEDIVFNSYNFPGWLLKSERQHNAVVQAVPKSYTLKERYDYDHTGREIAMHHEINSNGEFQTCSKEYDERGLLWQKGLHQYNGSDFLQYVDYTYNIRGWMTNINNINFNNGCGGPVGRVGEGQQPTDLFAMKLSYNFSGVPNSTGQFNGNISAMEWKIGCDETRAYGFTYDSFDRLTKADQYFYSGVYDPVDRYSVPLIEYDLDGNILFLQRKSAINGSPTGSLVDDLTYTYSSLIPNHLQSVADAANAAHPNMGFKGSSSSYTYDLNGNLKTDSHKGFTMSYNYLNLPYKAAFNTANLNPNQDFIEWQYDALGQKLQKKVTDAGNTESEKEYCSGIEYNNGDLEAIYFSEGRLVPDGMNW
ncbi:MAG: DUF6443 domain-containing protein, partial [Bacteroidota bacterium]